MIAFYFDDLQRWIYIHHHDVYLMKLFQSYFCIVFVLFYESLFLSNLVFNYYCYYYYYYIYFMGYRFPFIYSFNFSHSFVFYYVKVYRVFIIITDLKYIQHFHVSHNFMAIHCSQNYNKKRRNWGMEVPGCSPITA